MAETSMNSFRQVVRDMLAALKMPDVDDNELHDLSLRIGHTETKGEACLELCPIIFQSDEDGIFPQNSPPQTPPSADPSNVLRKSSRIGSESKRSYEGMQSRQGRAERPRKKYKYTLQDIQCMSSTIDGSDADPLDVHATDESITKATERSIEAVEGAETTIDKSSYSDAVMNASEPVHKALRTGPSTSPVEETPSDNPSAETAVEMSALSAQNRSIAENILPTLVEKTPTSVASIISCAEETTSSPLSNERINSRRSVLDESGNSLEMVLEALKTKNTSRITDSAVPGILAMLTDTDFTVFARIITSIGTNCVGTSLTSLASAVEIEKARLQEYERNRLSQIQQDRKQMALLFGARLKKEEGYREEEERLSRETKNAIASLNMRGLADRDLKDVLSEPTELMGKFKQEDEFENLLRDIDREHAHSAKKKSRASVEETYYWLLIKRCADMIGPLPESSGPKTGLTPQEKRTASRLVIALGYGHSRDSILKARSYLRLLSDLREAGVTLLLLFRTKEFRTHFLRHPNELAMILSWNELYHPLLHQLRLRAVSQAEGDFSGRCDLEDQNIFHRLHIPPGIKWREDLSDWADPIEKDRYHVDQSIKASSGKSNTYILRHGIKGDIDRNKSIYISMMPCKRVSEKKTLGGHSASTELLAVSPLVPISPGDFLGLLPGRLRYANEKPAGAMRNLQGGFKGLFKVSGLTVQR